jgi:hypothetical protein
LRSSAAAVIHNSPQILAGFGELTGTDTFDLLLGVVGIAVYIALASPSPTARSVRDRLVGGTCAVRPAAKR